LAFFFLEQLNEVSLFEVWSLKFELGRPGLWLFAYVKLTRDSKSSPQFCPYHFQQFVFLIFFSCFFQKKLLIYLLNSIFIRFIHANYFPACGYSFLVQFSVIQVLTFQVLNLSPLSSFSFLTSFLLPSISSSFSLHYSLFYFVLNWITILYSASLNSTLLLHLGCLVSTLLIWFPTLVSFLFLLYKFASFPPLPFWVFLPLSCCCHYSFWVPFPPIFFSCFSFGFGWSSFWDKKVEIFLQFLEFKPWKKNKTRMSCFYIFKDKSKKKKATSAPQLGQQSNSSDDSGFNRTSRSLPSPKSIPELYKEKEHTLRVFSYEELREATNGFSRLLKIGEGGFGSVYKGRVLPANGQGDPLVVAIKKLNKHGLQVQFIHNYVSLFLNGWVVHSYFHYLCCIIFEVILNHQWRVLSVVVITINVSKFVIVWNWSFALVYGTKEMSKGKLIIMLLNESQLVPMFIEWIT